MTIPHDSWAAGYDHLYEASFGAFYQQLTAATLEVITCAVAPPARVLDFGAGTGRLALPLAARGYEVTAVDTSAQMLAVLAQKPGAARVVTHVGRMQDFTTEQGHDLATCVFTVLLYLLTEEDLAQSIAAAARALRPGGQFLIDIPSRQLFQSAEYGDHNCSRRVRITPVTRQIFDYEETSSILVGGEVRHFEDRFQIRYWPSGFVRAVLLENGFEIIRDLSADFAATGSDYLLLRKR
jgi:SAM-dependent methyltransferase